LVRLTVTVAVARVDIAGGATADLSRGRQRLEAVVAEARRSGRRGLELDARLALLQSRRTEDAASVRDGAAELQKEARTLGFGLVARKAAALATPSTSVSTNLERR